MLRPIQEVLALTMDSIKSIRENSNICEVSTKDLILNKKEQMRIAYLQEDWQSAIMVANDLLDLPLSMVDKEQAIWTRRKAGEHLSAKCYL